MGIETAGFRRRWLLLALLATAVLCAAYVLAVRTATGQRLENAALRGALQVNPAEVTGADEVLATITVTSLGVAVAIVGLIGLIREGWWLACAGVATIGGPVVATEVLKRWVLPRPELVDAPDSILHNSFPSGHTTVAMAVACGVLVVVPWRWRTPAMIVVGLWAIGIGGYTVIARWHRASDTVGGNAMALIGAAVGALILARLGLVRPVPGRRAPLRALAVTLLALFGLLVAASGVLLTVVGAGQEAGETADYNLFLGADSIASAGSVFALLLAWYGWYRFETVTRG
ncbi:phosphatase PAP2 family protein [Gordonia sp. VNK21]|uniref:phosphatase PAP2 family protein n=1 Tax=Gordonia sp. VNK21 TaxID=3382483 RepID=UPI0038D4C794